MAELKIKADSGGGTVSLKGPATTTSNAAVQLTLPVDDGTASQYLQTNGSGVLSWATVSTDPTTTSGTNNFTVADGDLIIGTSGHGISFAATSDTGGMASELLDDYEEGTWTPVIKSGSNTITYDSSGSTRFSYVKVGNLCTILFALNNQTTSGTTGGNAIIEGLPFTCAAMRTSTITGIFYGAGLRMDAWPVATHINTSTSVIDWLKKSSASANYAEANFDQVGSSSYLFFTLQYETS